MAIQEDRPTVCDVDSSLAVVQAPPPRQTDLLPVVAPVPRTRPPGSRARPMSRMRLVALLSLLLLVAGLISLSLVLLSTPTIATITIYPLSTTAHQVVILRAVPGAPSFPDQLTVRSIVATSPTSSAPVTATGVFQQSARAATGTITFYNIAPFDQVIPAGTLLTAHGGEQFRTTADVTVLAGNAPSQTSAPGAAQATQAGPGGNIPTGAISMECCSNRLINGIYARNEQPFSGGQGAEHYAMVERSDIDQAAAPLTGPAARDALAAFKSQVRAGERLVADPTCATAERPSVPAGGRASAHVTVSVAASCRGSAYNWQDALSRASVLFVTQESRALGPSYAQASAVTSSGTPVGQTDAKGRSLLLAFPLQGVWAYRVDRAALQQLLPKIAGKPWVEVQAILRRVAGVAQVRLSGSGETLPDDVGQIHLAVATGP